MNQKEIANELMKAVAAISRQLTPEESEKERFAAHVGRFAERVPEN
jgi:hypothetical protein